MLKVAEAGAGAAQEVAVGRQVVLQLLHPLQHQSLAQLVLVAVQRLTDQHSLLLAINQHTPLARALELTQMQRSSTPAVMFLQNQPTLPLLPRQQGLTHLAAGTEEEPTHIIMLVTIQ